MNDQIYRQTILDAIDANVGILYDSPTLVTSLKKMVNALPPVDAVPVVHGQWVNTDDGFRCNKCNHHAPRDKGIWLSRFCPDCGALMDGKGDDTLNRIRTAINAEIEELHCNMGKHSKEVQTNAIMIVEGLRRALRIVEEIFLEDGDSNDND